MQFSNDNTNWSAPEAYTTSRTWTLSAGDGAKTVYAKFKDAAGNWSTAISDTITLDTAVPTGSITINSDDTYTTSANVTLNLSAADTYGLALMQFSNNQTSWSPAEPYASSKSRTLSSGEGPKIVCVKYADNAGNWSIAYDDTIQLDSTVPATAVSPSGALYNSSQVVTLQCNDGSGSGCNKTYYTTDGSTPTTSSNVYSTPINISSTTTLKFFSTDIAGNMENVKTETYTIDTTPPSGSISINSGLPFTNSTSVTLGLTASDANGVSRMQFSNNNTNWSSEEPYATSKAWTLSSGDGEKTVYARFKDAAGNWSAVVSDTIVLDTTPPAASASPAGGTYTESQPITLTCADGAGSGCNEIYYTTDNTMPATSSPVYSSPINITKTTTLKFFAKDIAGNQQGVRTEVYQVYTVEDSDSDGMPDWWEATHFGDLTHSAGEDADGDKFTNGREYQDDTDPNDIASHLVLPAVFGRVPDTDQNASYTDTFGEDSDYGINPPLFIKMDAQGNYLADTAAQWTMVRDAVTGLIWEVKENKDGATDYSNPNDADNTYTWYDANPETNGGNQGTAGEGTDTEDFINALNAAGLGGYSDWRVPTVHEPASILNRDASNPSVNSTFFPNMQAFYYWTSSTSLDDFKYLAWSVNFVAGNVGPNNKAFDYHVRVVRGETRERCAFVADNDATVTDTSTGLMWQQDAAGPMTWEEAVTYAETASLAGYDDWRLPNINELHSLADYARHDPAIDSEAFPGAASSYGGHWSSTTDATGPERAWCLSFTRGTFWANPKTEDDYYVRIVRGGQDELPDRLLIASPSQAGRWVVGTGESIVWDPRGVQGNVQITMSRNGGKAGTFETIAGSVANTGAHAWTVTGPVSASCVVKIEPIDDATKATTQGMFAIASATPPVATVSGAPAGPTKQKNATLTVAGDLVTAYRYKLDNGAYGNVTPVSTTISLIGLADGAHIVYVIGRDDAGDWQSSASPTTVSWIVDTLASAPAGLDLAQADDSGVSNSDNLTRNTTGLTISGTGEEGATVRLYDNGIEIPDATGAVAGGVFSINTSLAEGVHTITARQSDLQGNMSAASAPLGITIDITAPNVAASPAGGLYKASKSVTLQSTDATAKIYYNSTGTDPRTNGTLYFFAINIMQSSILKFYAEDAAGNASEIKTEIYEIDTIPPDPPVIDPAENVKKDDNPTPTFVWQAVSDAHHYLLEYANNADFTGAVRIDNITETSCTVADPLTRDGMWYWRVAAVDAAGNRSNWATFNYQYISIGFVRKAIIVAGGGPYPGNNLWPSTMACADFAFDILYHRGYWVDRIMYLSHEPSSENLDVDAVSDNANLEWAITTWAADADELVLYMNSHGGDGKLRMGENEWLTSANLDSWLVELQTQHAIRVIVVYDACQSGSFLPVLAKTGNQERILIASADVVENSYSVSDGTISFSWFFWSHADAGDSVWDAFVNAKNSIEYTFYYDQTPLLDANGNGIGNENPGDMNLASNVWIGSDIIPGPDFPVIASISPAQTLTTERSATLFADGVQGSNAITRVWATIIPPGFDPGSPDLPVTEVPTVELTRRVGSDRYEGTYDNFIVNGEYIITIYAKDSNNSLSAPMQTRVVKGQVLRGDVNGDTVVDLADAVLALQVMSGIDTYDTAYKAADVNADGKIGMAEVIYIMQEVAGGR